MKYIIKDKRCERYISGTYTTSEPWNAEQFETFEAAEKAAKQINNEPHIEPCYQVVTYGAEG